ncbi:hypothetical protein H8356DRAFT_243650 [Neocallimastix lanati (nom. inval.)]|uniref:HAD-like protein n=1 Tax=Neocallimastix californiae TaxID=1754190 RepID=A0A1Y2D9W3_9FUNG|nr:hypothetical protein H8356DRAFT_243650 [Neocallimastix sp. JGI-2020a]ORY55987.1 hypothetical protein LY90DRAFT_261732 [Neocallimastix californiae]|eukprot:ORY55987.1 hypothetical protein LY90DRAFT_261732 [Neocallimastix californiae]
MENKNLLLFDFDGTIVDGDIVFTMFEKTLSEEDYKLVTDFEHLNYAEAINKYYNLMKSYNKTMDDINPVLEEVKFNEDFPELFNYIRKNKDKFYVILITGDDLYPPTYFLKKKGLIDLFDYFIGIPSKLEDGETMVKVTYLDPHNCNYCDKSLCKNFEYKKFIEKHQEFKGSKSFYICDGWNDYCLASQSMKDSDVVLVREGFRFSNMLKDEKFKKNMKCNVEYWKNGMEIIETLKKYT